MDGTVQAGVWNLLPGTEPGRRPRHPGCGASFFPDKPLPGPVTRHDRTTSSRGIRRRAASVIASLAIAAAVLPALRC